MTTACPTRDEWSALLGDRVSSERREELAIHLEQCVDCRHALEGAAGDLEIPAGIAPTSLDASGRPAAAGTLLHGVISRLLASGNNPPEPGKHGAEVELPSGLLTETHSPGSLGRLGKYEILSIIGRGGLGVVLKGLDPQLNRIVAIKIPAPELAANSAVRKRFLREAQAAAAVSHDHVVTIHAVDEAQGVPYLVMEYIAGTSLDQEIERHGPFDLKKILRIGLQTAAGLAAAHKQGLVHRDVKPANILLENGVQRVKLTDFGLARAVDDASITQSGVVAGTPQYMSPEQARGEVVDARSDLFSLGAVLYAMCTGRPAFRADSTMAVLKRVCEDEPRPIEQINSEIPPYLIAIIDRLLSKKPADRIQTAQEVSDRLSAHLAHLQEPAIAHPPAPLPRRRKGRWTSWSTFLTDIVIAVALIAFTISMTWRLWRFQTGADLATPANLSQSAQTQTAETVPASSNVLRRALQIKSPSSDIHGAAFSPAGPVLAAGSGTTAYQWNPLTGAEIGWDSTNAGRVRCIRYSPDGQRAVVAGDGGVPYLRSGDLHNLEFRLEGLGDRITCVAWSSDGTLIAAGNETWNLPDNKAPAVAVWNAQNGQLLWKRDLPPRGDGGAVSGITFSNDNSKVIVSHFGTADVITGFDARDGRFLRSFGGPRSGDDPLCLAKIPGRDLILTGHAATRQVDNRWDDPDHAVINLWNFDNGELLKTFHGHRGNINSIDVSPDGFYLIAGSGQQPDRFSLPSRPAASNRLSLWVMANDNLAFQEDLSQSIREVRFAPDGRQIVSISGDGYAPAVVQLWEVDSRYWPRDPSLPLPPTTPERPVVSFDQEVYGVRFSPDGSEILTCTWGGSGLSRIQFASGAVRGGPDDRIAARYPFVTRAIYLPGQRIAATSQEGTFDLYDLSAEPAVQPFRPGQKMLWQISASADGKLIATGGDDGAVSVWHVDGGLRQKVDHPKIVRSVAISPDGQLVVSAGDDKTTRVWKVADGTELRRFNGIEVSELAFLPDSHRFVAAGSDYRVHLWDAQTGEMVRRFEGHTDVVVSVAVSADGELVASGSMDNSVLVWSVRTGDQLKRLSGHTAKVTSVGFSPDGQWLASSSIDRTVRLWPAPRPTKTVEESAGNTPKIRGFLSKHVGIQDGVYSTAMSPDGRRLISGHYSGLTCVWDVESGKELNAFAIHQPRVEGKAGAIHAIVPLADNQRVISGSEDGSVLLWNMESGEKVREFVGHTGRVAALAVFDQDRQLITGSADYDSQDDSSIRVWNVETGEELRRFTGDVGRVDAMSLSPDGSRLLTIDGRGSRLCEWDVASGQLVREIASEGAIRVAFAPDGRTFVTGHTARIRKDGRWNDPTHCVVRLWNAGTMSVERVYSGHTAPILDLEFVANGSQLLSISGPWYSAEGFVDADDRTVRLWDVAGGQELWRHDLDEWAHDLSSTSGRQFITGGDAMLRLWNLPEGLEPVAEPVQAPAEAPAKAETPPEPAAT